MPSNASIRAISYYLPEQIVSNDDLSALFGDWTPQRIYETTGIKNRRSSAWDEIASDCAVKAAHNLFHEHQITPEEIDYLLFCTQSDDYGSPTTACVIQHRLCLRKNIGAIDINQGCTGFIHGLSIAKGLLAAHICRNVLLLTSETLTKYIHPLDKSTRLLFGDAGAATLIEPKNTNDANNKANHSNDNDNSNHIGIGNFVLGTDGSGSHVMITRNRGLRHPFTHQTAIDYADEYGNVKNDAYFSMDGIKAFAFALRCVPPLFEAILQKHQLKSADIDLFIFHQANGYILEALRKKLNIPTEKFFLYIEQVGNTVSSSIPIALYEAKRCGKIQAGHKIMLLAFGVGLSWGGTIYWA